MRVIAGIYRSRPLVAPRGMATRPTSDRLRETLFNVIGPAVEDARFADLFAGSGAIGIEALSRGAAHAFFAESNSAAIAAIRRNLDVLGIRSGFVIETRPLPAALLDPGSVDTMDIVYLDPPYQAAGAYQSTLDALGRPGLVTEGGLVIVEHERRRPSERKQPRAETLGETYGSLRRYRTIEQGDAALSFYRSID